MTCSASLATAASWRQADLVVERAGSTSSMTISPLPLPAAR
jgi:hypothetical protein